MHAMIIIVSLLITATILTLIGIKGIKRGVPFAIRGRWLMVAIMIPLAPTVANDFQDILYHGLQSPISWMLLMPTAIIALLLVEVWRHHTAGLILFGVSTENLRETLNEVLDNNKIEHKESLGKIDLLSEKASLYVASHQWMGTAQIKVKPARKQRLLVNLAPQINALFEKRAVPANLFLCYGLVATGVMVFAACGLMMYAALFMRNGVRPDI